MTDTIAKIQSQSTAIHSSPSRNVGELLKRAFDLSAAFCGLVVLSPVFALLAILIKRDGPGPVLYRGARLGKNGRAFHMLKFRTMYERPESNAGPRITAEDDPRITPLGHWLRNTKLNELPQLWNVLVGDMSLVGPRPEDPEIINTWPTAVRREILSVRPGITSPVSIIYRDEEKLLKSASVMNDYFVQLMPDKTRLDQLYVRNHSFTSDLDVLFYTLIALLPRIRKSTVSIESLYNGLLYKFTRRYFSWFVIDNLVAFAAVAISGALWRLSGPLDLGIGRAVLVAAGIGWVFSVVNSVLGLGRVWWRYAQPMYAFDLAFSSGISTMALAAADRLLWPAEPLLPLGMVLVAGLLAFLGFVFVRFRERLLTGLATRWLSYRSHSDRIGERVLIVGAGECAMVAAWLLQRSRSAPVFSVVGIVDDDPTKQGLVLEGHRILGLTRRIPELVLRHDIGVILFAIENIDPEEQTRVLGLCRQTSARLVIIPDLLASLREQLTDRSADTIPTGTATKAT